MLKSELLKLIEEVGDNDSVLETLKGIEGLTNSSIDYSKLTVEEYKTILENNKEIKGYQTSLIDSAVSKGVESFKTKKMPQYIEDEIKKRDNSTKTPEQIELEELKKQIDNMQKEKARAELSSKYTKVLNEKKLPVEFIDFILSDNEEVIESNIGKIETILTKAVSDGVTSKLGNGYTPPKNPSNNKLKVEDLANMSVEEINARWNDIER